MPDAYRDQGWLTPGRTRALLVLILGFSLLIGLVSVLQFRSYPTFNYPILDEQSYVSWAEEIASGGFIGGKVFYQDPLYPYFLALIFRIAGVSLGLVRVVQVALGTATVGLVFLTARRLMGDAHALAAAVLMSLCGALYFFELLLLKATLVIFFSALSCALGVLVADRPQTRWRWAAIGASLGLLCLLRGNFQPLLPFPVIWAFLIARSEPAGRRALRAGLVLAGILLILAPVSLRNYLVGGELVLTTSQGGANFYIGNNELADGLYVDLPFVRPDPVFEASDFKAEAERRAGRKLTFSQVSSFWFREAFKWIADNPEKAARLWAHKARLMVHNHEIPDNHSLYMVRNHFVWALRIPFLGFGLLWFPAILGTVHLLRRDSRAWYPALFALLYAMSIIPFFIVARYRLAVLPAMCVFAPASALWVREMVRNRKYQTLARVGAMAALALLISFAPTRESKWPQPFCAYNIANAYLDTGRPREAIQWYDRALKTLPGHPDITAARERAMRMLSSHQSRPGPGKKP